MTLIPPKTPPIPKTNPPPIIMENVVFRYAQNPPILQGISLQINKGERVALMGITGVGKSTLLEHLIGLKIPQSGQILIRGIPLKNETLTQIRHQVGFTFQNPDDQLFMPTILEDMMFGLRNNGMSVIEAKEKARFLLNQFGLIDYEHRSAHELSGGQKRLAALATILVLEPAILILDEPTNGLDPSWRRKLAEILLQLSVEVILIASHDLHWLKKTTHRALILAQGIIPIDQPTQKLLQDSDTLESYGLPLDW